MKTINMIKEEVQISQEFAKLTIPNAIASNVPNTWSYDTMARRILQDILPRIYKDNLEFLDANTKEREELRGLEASLKEGKLGNLTAINDFHSDNDTWERLRLLVPESERNWLDAPWLFAEFYFYRRVISAFNYFRLNHDPFLRQKMAGLKDSLEFISEIVERLPTADSSKEKEKIVELGIFTSLWGNKLDLSLWPKSSSPENASSPVMSADSLQKAGSIATSDQFHLLHHYILDDQVNEVINHLLSLLNSHNNATELIVDIVVDNAGYELISDFILAHLLLSHGIVKTVRFHTKLYPTFVSDATTNDCLMTIEFLKSSTSSSSILRQFGECLEAYHLQEHFQFIDDSFWCEPIPFWDMPISIINKLVNSSLVFIKGDANYRRLVGDRRWPFDTPARSVLSYWPVPVCALRTLKAEVACGISQEKQIMANSEDKKWLVSGRWAVVQFFCPKLST